MGRAKKGGGNKRTEEESLRSGGGEKNDFRIASEGKTGKKKEKNFSSLPRAKILGRKVFLGRRSFRDGQKRKGSSGFFWDGGEGRGKTDSAGMKWKVGKEEEERGKRGRLEKMGDEEAQAERKAFDDERSLFPSPARDSFNI